MLQIASVKTYSRNTIQLAQMQAGELWAKLQVQTARIASALCVFPRQFVWGAELDHVFL